MTKEFKIGNFKIGGKNPFVLIAGPCVIESEESTLYHAKKLKEITQELDIPFIFKSSYDKANRSSINSYRGPGSRKGLRILNKVRQELDIPIISDVHCVNQVKEAAEVLDIIQIPAFLCRQTDLVVECAKTEKPINVKKGQFLSPFDVGNIIDKIKSVNNNEIIITERGVSFGYHDLVNDFRSFLIMRKFGYPVCYDVTHSIQQPGSLGEKSGGESEFILGLSRAAIACGIDALFMEVHRDPEKALCDGFNMLKLNKLKPLLKQLKDIENVLQI